MSASAFNGFAQFFDRFCTELEDRRSFPYKTFKFFGAKSTGPPEPVRTCLAAGYLLLEAILARMDVEPALSAAQTGMYHNLMTSLSPADRVSSRYEYENPQCKFLKLAVTALTSLTEQEKAGLPIRLSHLMTNTTGGAKLETKTFLERGSALLRELRCKSKANVNLNAEAKRVLATVMAKIVPPAPSVPSGPVRLGGSRRNRNRNRNRQKRTRRLVRWI
jgi:hypothetical protein